MQSRAWHLKAALITEHIGRERPRRRRAAEERDELAPLHRADPNPMIVGSIAGQGCASQQKRPAHVRYGSKADICSAKKHVRFTPNSDIDCVFRHVRFGPKPHIRASEDYARPADSPTNTAARGKMTLISVNSPGCVSTSIEPPCCLTMMS